MSTANPVPPLFRHIIGLRVKMHRRKKGITQDALAQAAEVNMSQISRIEAGEGVPSMSCLLKIAWALSVHPKNLLPSLEDLVQEWGDRTK